jgi:thymidylate synthase
MMTPNYYATADAAWAANLFEVINYGSRTAPRPGSPYTGETLELINFESSFDMRFPVVTNRNRKLGYRFMAAEARWILQGDDRVETIKPYSKVIADFSDDGVTFFGAYGPRIREQMAYVVQTLLHDPASRQAVVNIWRPNPPKTKDVPCTIDVQFLIRDNTLHCIDNMRSSDLWLGWPYDVFNFTMLSASLLLVLRGFGMELSLGMLSLRAGSQHIYKRNLEKASRCLAQPEEVEYAPFDPVQLGGVNNYLTQLADHASAKLPWLGELFHEQAA